MSEKSGGLHVGWISLGRCDTESYNWRKSFSYASSSRSSTLLTSARLFQHRLGGHRWSEIGGSAVHLAYDDSEFTVDGKYSLDIEFVQLAIDMILVLAHEETFFK